MTPQATPDFEAEGLLDGLEGDARAARRELLEHLHRDGVSLAELRRAVAEDRLALVPAERVLAPEQKYTAAEVGRRAGIDHNLLLAQRRAAGLSTPKPRERAFSDEDVEAARRLAFVIGTGIPSEAILEGARVFGHAAAEAAAAARILAGESFLRPGDSEREVALRYAEAARVLYPQTVRTLEYLYGAHLREQLRNDMIAAAELATGRLGGTRRVVVCFADLVGFTRLGQQVDPDDLGGVARRLSTLAREAARKPVELIKMIGDAAMLVSPEPEPLVDAALDLVERSADDDGLPDLKAGLAAGEAINRFGDWYGGTVNLASRVTALARPGSVLATREVRDAAPETFGWSFAGRHRLKGVEQAVPLYRVRRASDSVGRTVPRPRRRAARGRARR